jgi:hypothetical protein
MGVFYAWYYTFHPAGPEPTPELALTAEQQVQMRRFIVDMRVKKPISIVDVYYDHQGRALCPSATGFAHHISPGGDIEPCPVIQIAKDSIYDERPLYDVFNDSTFLKEYRELALRSTRGCILLEHPDLLRRLADENEARDTTQRGTVMKELAAYGPMTSQDLPGEEIPEKSWAYRLVKRFFFNDFGAYKKYEKMHKNRGGKGPEAYPPEDA